MLCLPILLSLSFVTVTKGKDFEFLKDMEKFVKDMENKKETEPFVVYNANTGDRVVSSQDDIGILFILIVGICLMLYLVYCIRVWLNFILIIVCSEEADCDHLPNHGCIKKLCSKFFLEYIFRYNDYTRSKS